MDDHPGHRAVLIDVHRGRGAFRGVGAHIGQEIVDHLAQPGGIAQHLDRVRGGLMRLNLQSRDEISLNPHRV